ncbi:MAG: hypothetical protein LUG18_00790 [Candidatus Azobacteroides sp.]|nr:hypothetical protein [Candidatus Azobacteroides sp.]
MKKIKFLLFFLLFLPGQAKPSAWQTYICYYAASTNESDERIPYSFSYLRPVVYYECIGFSSQSYISVILDKLSKNRPESLIFICDYDDITVTVSEESFLRVTLSLDITEKELERAEEERNELLASILFNGYHTLTLRLKDDKEVTFSKDDILLPYFEPFNFREDEAYSVENIPLLSGQPININ